MFLTRLVKEQPLGLIGGIIVLLFLFTGIFADWLAPYGVNDIHPRDYLHPPSTKYFLGADNLGRDIYSRIVFGARISMIVGLGATTLAILIALLIGVPSGYFGGKFDMVVQRFVDGWICFPPFIIFLFAVSIVGPGMWQLIIAMGLVQGIGVSRIMRSAVIAIRENMYVEAAAAIGSPTTKIITRHILPNIMPTIIILFSATVPGMILGEAGLSFLGLGIPPPDPNLGRNAQWLWTLLYVPLSFDVRLAWSGSDDCRLRPQHFRRRPQGFARPPVAGRCRALWRVSPKESFMIFGAERISRDTPIIGELKP